MLPFDAEVLFSFFAQYNRDIWPAQVVAVLLCALAFFFVFRPKATSGRSIGAILVASWATCGIVFHYLQFAALNFAAPLYAAFFLAQALLLGWALLVRSREFRFRRDAFGRGGVALSALGIIGYPLIDGLAGHGWSGVRLVGVTPSPTTLFTVGLLLLLEGKTPLYLLVIPLLWSLVDGATAWLFATYEDLVLPIATIGGIGLAIFKSRSLRRSA